MLAKNSLPGKRSPHFIGSFEIKTLGNKGLARRATHFLLTALFCALAMSSTANGQSYQGSLRGSLHDSTGNALANVTLSLINEATNLTRATVTNATGEYVFDRVDPGKYKLEAASSGFKKQKPS